MRNGDLKPVLRELAPVASEAGHSPQRQDGLHDPDRAFVNRASHLIVSASWTRDSAISTTCGG